MLLITLFLSTLCAVRMLAGSDLEPRHRQKGFAGAQIGSAGAQIGSAGAQIGSAGVRAFFHHR